MRTIQETCASHHALRNRNDASEFIPDRCRAYKASGEIQKAILPTLISGTPWARGEALVSGPGQSSRESDFCIARHAQCRPI